MKLNILFLVVTVLSVCWFLLCLLVFSLFAAWMPGNFEMYLQRAGGDYGAIHEVVGRMSQRSAEMTQQALLITAIPPIALNFVAAILAFRRQRHAASIESATKDP